MFDELDITVTSHFSKHIGTEQCLYDQNVQIIEVNGCINMLLIHRHGYQSLHHC